MSKATKAARTREGRTKPSESIRTSSENIFADLGLPNPEEHLVKAELALQLARLIRGAGMTQAQAARRLGVDQPKISALLRGRLKDFSVERLMRFLLAMDRDVIITIRPPRARPALRVSASA